MTQRYGSTSIFALAYVFHSPFLLPSTSSPMKMGKNYFSIFHILAYTVTISKVIIQHFSVET